MKMVRKSAGLNVCRFFCFGDKCVFLLIFIFFCLFKLKVFTKILVGTIMLLVLIQKNYMKEEVGKMKRRCKRLLALFLSVGMLATQFPSVNTTIMADTGTETSDSTSETTGISEDTVIATNDWDYADTHGSEWVYISNHDSIFYIIAKKLNKSGSTINLTYGDVKGITEFTISDENTDRYYVNVDNLDKLLPNLTKLTTSKSVSGSSSLKLHELNYVGNGDYAGNVSEAFDVSELDRISVAGGYIDLGDKK